MSQTLSSDGAAPGRNRLSPIWGNWANPPFLGTRAGPAGLCRGSPHPGKDYVDTDTLGARGCVCGGGGDIFTPLTTSATASLFLRQMRTSRFRGLDLPKATALHVKATATRPCSSPRSPSESFMRSPAPQQLFLCRLGEAGPPDALPRAPEQ